MRYVFILLTLAVPVGAAQAAPTFEGDVLPILNAHCLQCHGGVHQKAGLDLRSRESALAGARNGAVVVPGKVDESVLWKKLHADQMPKTDNKVSAANKAVIRAWIEGGARGAERRPEARVDRKAMKPADFARVIGREVAANLAAAKIPGSPRAEDGEWQRRAWLDIAGRPPTAREAADFLADSDPEKRAKLVDRLLATRDYGRHFAERWVNQFYLTTVSQRPERPEPFVAWLGKKLVEGRPWNEVVHDILTADGPLSHSPQGLFFYYAGGDMNGNLQPKILAGNVAQSLLGVQLQCAECHNHPFTTHRQTDFWAMAAFFGQTARLESVENKRTPGIKERHLEVRKNKPRPVLKEVAISISNDGEARNGGKKVPAGVLDGAKLAIDPNASHRPPFARWLTSKDNRQFARAEVNRLWAHFFGRGLVHPLNDFADHNPPSHPALLEALTDEFIASGFSTRHLVRCICASEPYHRTSAVVAGNGRPEADALLARMPPKVLTPEQMYDALCRALEVPEIAPPADPKKRGGKPNPKLPPPPSPRSLFAAAFRGPGEADDPAEMKLGVPHTLRLMNGRDFNDGGRVVPRLMEGAREPAAVIEGLFLAALSRKPTAAEAEKFVAFAARQKSPREAYARVLWVLLNSSEFLLVH